MADSCICDADALFALSRLVQPPAKSKPVYDIVSALPRELALEVICPRARIRRQTPLIPPAAAGPAAAAGEQLAVRCASLSPVE
jgi:hypothetical protein